eukprot:7640144-Heterocapsa_arctica.AAC.1
MGQECTGAPEKGNTRYCRWRQGNLTRYALGLNLSRGRNADRPIFGMDDTDVRPILEQLLGGPPRVVPPLDG